MSSFDTASVNNKRLLLRLMVKMMLWISLLVGAWVVFTPLFKNKKNVNTKAIESVFDVSHMNAGDVDIIEWFSKPLIIAHRTQKAENQLQAAGENEVYDPDSEESSQPEFAGNALRSSTPGWFVSLGLGSGSGCALQYQPPSTDRANAREWPGGFIDNCDGSHYDLAGRVLVDQAARKNTTIPVWRLESGKLFVSTAR